MPRRMLDANVFEAALERMISIYAEGHRVVNSFSGGKDSGLCVELAIMAARITNRLPIEVAMRDEEIMFPGTFEYSERIAAREEIDFHWCVAKQPIVNIYNRKNPYFWAFDPLLDPEDWVRKPPEIAYDIPEYNIEALINAERFPPAPGKNLYIVIGLRVSESINRRLGIYSSKGWLTKIDRSGVGKARPVYDWSDGDVWKAIFDNQWDYNVAYDTMHRLGINRKNLRIAPPTLAAAGIEALSIAHKAWPDWFSRVQRRLPGIEMAAKFGRRAVEPDRRMGESWKDCFFRECIEDAPDWISHRATLVWERVVKRHKKHAGDDLPDRVMCPKCKILSSYYRLAKTLYMGDPFSLKQSYVPYMEPHYFRDGDKGWGGKATW